MTNQNDKYKLKPVGIPSDDELFYERPFFAYGIFKKGQLAYSNISDSVEMIIPDEIPRRMHIRDGVPIIVNEDDEVKTKGDKIYFNQNVLDAYDKIGNIQPKNIYKWDTIDIADETFNILVTENIEGTYENVDEEGNYLDTFDGSKDPFFTKVPGFIRSELKKLDFGEEDSIFKIQMYYMLLWSAIERYSVLKYEISKKQTGYLFSLSMDEVFKDAFKGINAHRRESIYSAKNATPFYFNRKRPNFIINYYYTIRCNVAHRGKEARNNIKSLKDSLNELLDIFEVIVEKTFSDDES